MNLPSQHERTLSRALDDSYEHRAATYALLARNLSGCGSRSWTRHGQSNGRRVGTTASRLCTPNTRKRTGDHKQKPGILVLALALVLASARRLWAKMAVGVYGVPGSSKPTTTPTQGSTNKTTS
ncbi:hypothetical protein DFS34DRAFT_648991 [Phlyctochytrium arcticum]|nr:hypothetical protein DFS34DRAFT_648991 [Phlyctochytrium arcticum]